ncbi:MAG: hypothetical protein WC254_03850, partial [Candidatus Woesearchaeota archaeon]
MKAQVSFEFMMSMVIGMLVVLALIVMFANKLHEVVQDSRSEQIEIILSMIEDEVTFAKGAMTGYTRIFTLPVAIEGGNYSLNLTESTIAISYEGKEYTTGFNHRVNGSLCLTALNETTREFEVKRSATEVTLSACPDCVPNYYNCSYYDIRTLCSELSEE